MSDTTLNRFVASGTAAEMALFTPAPPTPLSGPDSGYFWYQTDTGNTYSWDGAAWQQVNVGGPPVGAQYVTLATDGTLTNERVLTGTSNQIVVTDNGAGSTVVLSTPQNLNTGATPQFARIGLGAAADAAAVGKFAGQYFSPLVAAGNSGVALTIDWNSGNEQLVTLTGNVTFTFSNPVDGGRYVLLLATGAGSFTATWPGTVKWPGGTAPTITVTASKVDLITFIYTATGTTYYGSFNQNY